jgi:hypothetical protein
MKLSIQDRFSRFMINRQPYRTGVDQFAIDFEVMACRKISRLMARRAPEVVLHYGSAVTSVAIALSATV